MAELTDKELLERATNGTPPHDPNALLDRVRADMRAKQAELDLKRRFIVLSNGDAADSRLAEDAYRADASLATEGGV